MQQTLATLVLTGNLLFMPASSPASFPATIPNVMPFFEGEKVVMASESMDIMKRNPSQVVTETFRDNILLNLHYMKGDVDSVKYHGNDGYHEYHGEKMINWEKIREPFGFDLALEPGELFSFHDEVLPEFKDLKKLSGWTQFSVLEGYKFLGGLSGNGVCHLATLINWVSSEAGLSVTAKVNHDFLPVPGVDRKYGTSIVYIPGAYTTQMQNLYVVNSFDFPVTFHFGVGGNIVNFSILK